MTSATPPESSDAVNLNRCNTCGTPLPASGHHDRTSCDAVIANARAALARAAADAIHLDEYSAANQPGQHDSETR